MIRNDVNGLSAYSQPGFGYLQHMQEMRAQKQQNTETTPPETDTQENNADNRWGIVFLQHLDSAQFDTFQESVSTLDETDQQQYARELEGFALMLAGLSSGSGATASLLSSEDADLTHIMLKQTQIPRYEIVEGYVESLRQLSGGGNREVIEFAQNFQQEMTKPRPLDITV